jgi:hypothetical protein
VLALPGLVLLVIGSFPATTGLQRALVTGAGFAVVVTTAVLGLAWTLWRLVRAAGRARALRGSPLGAQIATVRFRILLAGGTLASGAVITIRILTGGGPSDPLAPEMFLLDALTGASVGVGVALLLLAFLSGLREGGLLFALAEGGGEAAGGAINAAGLVGRSALAGALLGMAISDTTGGGSGRTPGSGAEGAPDIPQRPPARAPHVEDPKLRNILGSILRPAGPSGVGDGSTVDAVRNEIRTGRPTKGQFHNIKARIAFKNLGKRLKEHPDASERDRAVAVRNTRAPL